MPLHSIAFFLGVLLLQQQEALLPFDRVWLLPFIVFAMPLSRVPRLALAFAAGFLWALLFAHLALAERLSPDLEGSDLVVEGWPASIPEYGRRSVRFIFEVEQAFLNGEPVTAPRRIRIAWYDRAPPTITVGSPWRLTVRVRAPSGSMNVGGFDYERWLFRQGIGATAYVRVSGVNVPLPEIGVCCTVNRLRHRLSEGIGEVLAGRGNAGIVAALAVGHRADIPRERWKSLLDTGTNHLMAISGLHIGLVAGLAGLVTGRVWRRFPVLCLRFPAQRAAAVSGILAAAGYALLAGFAIPTQRALVMVCVVAGALVLGRTARPSHPLAMALASVLVIDPLAVLEPGFWLSFAAVAAILWWLAARDGRGRSGVAGLVRLQFAITLAIFPLTVWFFQQGVLIAPLANLVAVPWVGLAVVPPALAGAVLLPLLPWAGERLLLLADLALMPVWPFLDGLAALPFARVSIAQPPLSALIAAVAGAALLLAPRGLPGRPLGAVLLLPLLLHAPERPRDGDFTLTLLDVGQGLAAVIETARHAVLYDTGPPFGENLDAGEAVVRPFLVARGIRRLERVIVSHGGSDHSGGLESVRGAVDVGRVLSNGVGDAMPCHAGMSWRLDGVRFDLLHPPLGLGDDGNDASCVLRVSSAGGSLLLTGDIESLAEAVLVKEYGREIASDVLLLAHHGSRSSSTARFLDAVEPRIALISVAHRSRYGHPHPEVLDRVGARGIELLRTDESGALTLHFRAKDGIEALPGHRVAARRYWHRTGASR